MHRGAKANSDTPQRVLDVREELLVVGLNCSANCIHVRVDKSR